MTMVAKIILLFLIILISNTIQGITGFAGTILAMPFSILLIGIDNSKQILNLLGMLASIWIVIRSYKDICWEEFLKIIIFMTLGLLIGMKLYSMYSPTFLLKILGIFILFVSLRGVLQNNKTKINNKIVLSSILLFAGIIHGMFVVGGPIVVIYATYKLKDKSTFRATLSLVWIVLNGIIFIKGIISGKFSREVMGFLIPSILALGFGMVLGEVLYKKMNQNVFMKITYILLFISGFSILIK
ncbi:MAG: sulfite exporter TauE/SafE family protein [Caloramator sp.]|nr:sulfite exporter TauE/SafE family protein [Caloramator sp.]